MPWAKGMRSAMPGYAPLEDSRSVGLMGLHLCMHAVGVTPYIYHLYSRISLEEVKLATADPVSILQQQVL